MESDAGLVNVLIGADLKAVCLQGLNSIGQVPGASKSIGNVPDNAVTRWPHRGQHPSPQMSKLDSAEAAASAAHLYCANMPPSITNSLPVTKDDSSEAKYRAPKAMS